MVIGACVRTGGGPKIWVTLILAYSQLSDISGSRTIKSTKASKYEIEVGLTTWREATAVATIIEADGNVLLIRGAIELRDS